MDLLNKTKGNVTANKEVYYPAEEVAGGLNDSNLKYNVPKDLNSGGGSGGIEPLIIHVTEEAVKDPRTQETVGYKTDVLASDAYEAWQSGRPIYFALSEDEEWLVPSVNEQTVVVILVDESDSVKIDYLNSIFDPDGYLVDPIESKGGDDN
jgi:hypothetical protein